MMTVDEMIAVLTHYKNGGVMQCKHESESIWQTFADCDPRWDFVQFAYRAKPEPLTIWVELDKNGVNAVYKYEEKSRYGGTMKKFVEVTE